MRWSFSSQRRFSFTRTFGWLFSLAALAAVGGCAELRQAVEKPPRLAVGTDGPRDGALAETPEVGDTVTLGLSALAPGAGAEIQLIDDLGREWSYARVFADAEGRVDPFV